MALFGPPLLDRPAGMPLRGNEYDGKQPRKSRESYGCDRAFGEISSEIVQLVTELCPPFTCSRTAFLILKFAFDYVCRYASH